MEGFEPPNGGTRTRCLTTWRHPIGKTILAKPSKKIKRLPKNTFYAKIRNENINHKLIDIFERYFNIKT